MQIILFRHGEPTELLCEAISAADLRIWIDQYNNASVRSNSHPDENALATASEGKLFISSDLKRSKASAIQLSTGQSIQEDSLFREAGLPYSKYALFKAKPKTWAVLFRVLWYLGYYYGSESKSDVKERSKQAAIELIMLASKYQTVVFVGHGIFNRFLAKELISQGFNGPRSPSSSYWGFSTYENAKESPHRKLL